MREEKRREEKRREEKRREEKKREEKRREEKRRDEKRREEKRREEKSDFVVLTGLFPLRIWTSVGSCVNGNDVSGSINILGNS
jgi:hypothetical protein